MAAISTSIHRVEKIELAVEYPSNGNSRTIRITSASGEFELVIYGETDSLAGLPKAKDYRFEGFDRDPLATEAA